MDEQYQQNISVSLWGTGEGGDWIIESEYNIKSCAEGAKKIGGKTLLQGHSIIYRATDNRNLYIVYC